MSLFQCESCGCCENTALTHHGGYSRPDHYNWEGKEHLKGKKLCSACSPTHFDDGTICPKAGKWHGKFKRVYLPKGMFVTDREGNLKHKESGSTKFNDYALEKEDEGLR